MSSSKFLTSVKSHELPSEIEFLSAIAYVKSLYPEDKELQSLSEIELIKELSAFNSSPEVISLDNIKVDITSSKLQATPCTDAIAKLIFDVIRIVIRAAGYSIANDGDIAKEFIAKLSEKIDFSSPIWYKIAEDFSNAKGPSDIAKCMVSMCRILFQLGIIKIFVDVMRHNMGFKEWYKFAITIAIQIGKFIATEGAAFITAVISMSDELDTIIEDAQRILNSCILTFK
jgi:hypothetical protein